VLAVGVVLQVSPREMVTRGAACSAAAVLSPGSATTGGSTAGAAAAAGCCGGGFSTGATGVRRKEVLMSAGKDRALGDRVSRPHRVSQHSHGIQQTQLTHAYVACTR
jgi:hypothetical protein